MYLRNLKLINFQIHAELEINFVNGVNVVHGDSKVGKSCLKHAIEFLAHHDTFKGQRKVGTKITSVKGEFSNDATVERILSASINRYILTKDGKESVFDSVGRSAPEEIQNAIGIFPITVDGEEIYLNSESQVALPFLFDKSPSFRMKLFNKLTGNDVLDKLFGQFNKDILRIKRGHREETELFETRAIDLKKKQIEKEKAEAVHGRLKKRVENIKKLHEKYSNLLELKSLLEANTEYIYETKIKLKNLKVPQATTIKQLKEKIDRYTEVKTVKNDSEKVCAGLDRVRCQLKAICSVSIDTGALNSKIERFDTLLATKEKFDKATKLCYTIKEEMKNLDSSLRKKKIEYKELLKEAKILCPNCQHDITEDCLRR